MKKVTRYFVRYYSPGTFVDNEWDEYVKSKSPKRVQWHERAYAFQMYEREDVVDGDTVYKGTAKKLGPLYYHPHSRIEGLESVQRREPNSILCRNMEGNHWDKIVWDRWGNGAQPFTKDCAILEAKP